MTVSTYSLLSQHIHDTAYNHPISYGVLLALVLLKKARKRCAKRENHDIMISVSGHKDAKVRHDDVKIRCLDSFFFHCKQNSKTRYKATDLRLGNVNVQQLDAKCDTN